MALPVKDTAMRKADVHSPEVLMIALSICVWEQHSLFCALFPVLTSCICCCLGFPAVPMMYLSSDLESTVFTSLLWNFQFL